MRATKQRELILEQLQTHRDHPSADIIYQEVRDVIPNISLGTVYRNLEWLVEKNLAKKLNIGSSKARFDYNTSSHAHFCCVRCKKVEDVEADFGFYLINDEAWISQNKLIDTNLEFYGVCKNCLEKEACL